MIPAVEFIMKYWFVILMTSLMIMICAVLYQNAQKHDFQIYVNNEIERSGGLTEEALARIEEYSLDNYNGRFKMLTATEKKQYGEVIDYTFSLTITPLIFDIDIINREFSGKASSKVR